MSPLRLAALSFLTPLLLAPLSCGQLGALGDALEPYTPKISFKNLDLKSIDFTRINVDFVFSIDNPNPIEVKLDTFSYAFGLENVELLSGTNDDGIKLESRGSSALVLPMSLRFEDIFALVGAVKGKDDLGFSLAGDFGFRTPLGVAKVPFREEGRFPVVHAPDISLAGLRMGKLDILTQTASLNLDLGIKNESGGSALAFSGLDYRVSLGQSSVAAGLVDAIPEVAPGVAQTVTIPINLNLRSLGSALVSAITQKKAVDVSVGATVQVGTPFGTIPLTIDEKGNLNIF